MQKSTKYIKIVPLLLAGAMAVTTLIAAPVISHRHGTDILHFFVRKGMTNDGVLTNASGRVDVKQNKQGNANNQKLDITVKNLAANAPYQLLALLNDDTNYTQVGEFTSDAKGRAALYYRKVGSSNGNGLGRGKLALPAVVDPITQIREVAITMNATQTVLRADLTAPDKLQYLVKRDLSTDTVDATLRINANMQQTQFRLLASHLAPTNDYLLVLNGGIVQTNSTDAKGRLAISSPLENPVDVLNLRTVALWDTASNVVVSTTLP